MSSYLSTEIMSTKNQQIWGQLWGVWQQRPPNAESCVQWPKQRNEWRNFSYKTKVESGLKIMNAYIMISWLFFVFHMLFVFPMLFLLHSLKNIHLKFALQQACWCLTNFTASAAASSSIAYGINKVPLTHALLILWLLLGVKLLVSSHVSPPSISQKDPLNPSSHVFCASLCTAETMDDGHDENPNLMWSLTEAWELNSKPTFSNKIDLYIHHSK